MTWYLCGFLLGICSIIHSIYVAVCLRLLNINYHANPTVVRGENLQAR